MIIKKEHYHKLIRLRKRLHIALIAKYSPVDCLDLTKIWNEATSIVFKPFAKHYTTLIPILRDDGDYEYHCHSKYTQHD